MKKFYLFIICLLCVFLTGGIQKASQQHQMNALQTENINEKIYSENIDVFEDSRNTQKENAKYAKIDDFPIVNQMPELPTGCEITALTMVLQYYGFPAEKTDLAYNYLPIASASFYYDEENRLCGLDLNEYFVGDPGTVGGYICGTEAICKAANDYLKAQGSSLHAIDISGVSFDELYQFIENKTPVVVWVMLEMAIRGETKGWYTQLGEYVEWSTNDHGAVLIGYDEEAVTIADPICGEIQYSRQQFETVFSSRGNKCVILKD